MKNKAILFLVLLFAFFGDYANGQNLFDYSHSKRYAEHLYKTGQFELATREFERLLYLNPTDDTVKTQLLRSYRLSNEVSKGIERAVALYPMAERIPHAGVIEYSKLLINAQKWEESKRLWQLNGSLTPTERQLLLTSQAIFKGNLGEARTSLAEVSDTSHVLYQAYTRALTQWPQPRKSEALAGALSAIVPGLGRVYAKDWRDAILSFVFTATLALQSYRGFEKSGVSSVRGWIYGGMAAGFYAGNIYGSVKAARRYNQQHLSKIQHAASESFSDYYAY